MLVEGVCSANDLFFRLAGVAQKEASTRQDLVMVRVAQYTSKTHELCSLYIHATFHSNLSNVFVSGLLV